ncbi:YcxB family protein [Paenibacillus sp. SYP-B3998]|uniref:YcxB family protein n=1 Tax=Paenibacillus sp. SYP-B3998 TaxID=2678564 RepID=A0A6G3ZQY1_9BACL|nr:YcxB family protein [Paenibacillus sp. SYP-B3998]NEW04613.1 YcxB family protein [Paenibacillus sp. SYP-B3998]
MIKISTNITRSDYWNYNKYAYFNIPKLRNRFIISNLSLPVIVMVLLLLFKLPLIFSLCWGIFGGGLASLFAYLRMKKRVMSLPESNDGILGERLIEIDETGVYQSNSVSQSSYKWNGVKSIEQNEAYIFIFVDTIMAYIIPKRSFVSDKDCLEFYHQAQIYFSKYLS